MNCKVRRLRSRCQARAFKKSIEVGSSSVLIDTLMKSNYPMRQDNILPASGHSEVEMDRLNFDATEKTWTHFFCFKARIMKNF